MKLVCIGGGPAGLYLAISMKLRGPQHEVSVYERNRPGDTYGWGVVFSDQTLENLAANDPVSAAAMAGELIRWDYIDVKIRGQVERSGGHGFIGIGRRRMLEILSARAAELGVALHYSSEVAAGDLHTRFPDADLIVAADGLNSQIRNADRAGFQCDIELRPNRFVWLGTHQRFDDAFTFMFEQTPHGWVWAHAYQFDRDTSTFIVECSPRTYEAWGFERMSHEQSAETCRRIFEQHLGGHALLTNSAHVRGSAWIRFPRVLCRRWVRENVVLIGDAAHTAHFSIGSGTKLGFEDAIGLARHLDSDAPLQQALQGYQAEREVEALKLQSAARNSMSWFEDIERYLGYDTRQFTYALLTRSQRVSHENLRLRDPEWLGQVERSFASKTDAGEHQVPPMFTPFHLRGMTLANRIVVSPMSMYSAVEGLPDDWHLVHYGALARGGAGLVYTEMTDVSPEARISPGCAGLWNEAQEAAWRRIVGFVHAHSQARFCLQLGHAGPKGSTRVSWEGDNQPLANGNWEIVGPSPVPYSPANQVPRPMTRADMDRVREEYVAAARRAERVGFDMIELHYAHGYLMSAFITPVLNRRTDEYGGSLANRLRYPLEVFAAVRAVWPQDKPIAVRISSNDWVGDLGVTPAEAVEIARAFKAAGVDIIDVSAGQTTPDGRPVYGRMFQTPFSDQIRNEAQIATMAVGNIYEVDHVNSILAAGRADLCCLARPHLMDPNWTLRAAAQQRYRGDAVRVPVQYLTGYEQLERNLQRAAEMVINV
ncbi:MAG TPA: bifunctional salicylyl-CoA 5-hydroxylase/oxidoreductase [Candidatus Binatia bacterium]|nr:bifunctional salicylyl-CoA 5-hydroxylase/oxidoreductase [Candidatus Binatia bacterium]